MSSDAPLIDPFGRRIDYVRLSVTDRCNFRCTYCMPADVRFQPRRELLTFEEMEQLARVLARAGVRSSRLTGGEPSVRRGFEELLTRLARAKEQGLVELSMTTNAWSLAREAERWRAAGLDRVNISLDTLDRERFAQITGQDRLHDVLAGIERVVELGWRPVKINVVVCRGLNEDEVWGFVERFAELPVVLRFIEYMPFGAPRFPLVSWDEVERLLRERFTLLPLSQAPVGSGPATYFAVEGARVTVGAIGARSAKFCEGCNRVRVTATGALRNCLAYEPDGVSLRDAMRGGADDDELDRVLRAGIERKPRDHRSTAAGGVPFEGHMVHIGG